MNVERNIFAVQQMRHMRGKPDYKWIMLLLVSTAYFLAQGTRQIYSAVLPQIKAEFIAQGVTDAGLGMVGSAFTLVFGIVIPFAGVFADLSRRKWLLVIGGLLFSCGIFFSGSARSIGALIVFYGVLNAVGQSLMPPCNTSLIGQFHTGTRGTAFSIYQSAIYLGIIVCSVGSGIFASSGGEDGWRKAFWIFGAIAALWTVVMAVLLKDTPQPQYDGAVKKASISEALRAFVSKPTAIILMGALGCYFFATYGFKMWVPMFMMRVFPDMPLATAVFHAVFWFYIGAFAGVTLAGRVSDRLKPVRSGIRYEVELAGILLCVPCILLMAWAQNLPVMIISVTLFGFATGVYDSNLYASLLEVINPRYRAAATGIFGCGGCIVGALGPMTMGWINDMFSIRVSFAMLSVFALMGAGLIAVARFHTLSKDKVE